MLSGKNQAGTQPYALGSLLQAATYGAAVPVIYGCTLSPLLATWAANLRQGGSTKKFKQEKKGITAYCENITFLLGHNPILTVLQMWNNGGTIPLAYTSQTFTGPGPWTITDANFYAVVGVSVEESYNVSFDDYGGSPVTESGTFQVPLWNELMTGPDPVRNSGYRNYPYCYKWQPSYGATVQADATDIFTGASVTIYYAALTAATSYQSPLARNRLSFENVLGDGPEYSGFTSQQILYPMFAGCGSASIDLGSSGAIPQLQAEVLGKWGLYSQGDGDFADMIEDIFKSGLAQSAIGAVTGTAASTPVEHGLSAYSYPGCVQMKCLTGTSSSSLAPIGYNLAVTEGNFLVVVGVTNGTGGGALSISDSGGNSWTSVLPGTPGNQVWYAQANATGNLTVTVSGQGNGWSTSLIEVSGVDTFDSVAVGVAGATSIQTTNQQNFPGYLLSIALYPGQQVPQPAIPLWRLLTPVNYYGQSPAAGYSVQEMPTDSPISITLDLPAAGLGASLILAFKCVNPPTYPDPVGDFLDTVSLDLVRLQCRANGLWGSLSMSSQQAASDYLTTLFQAADAAAVFLGFKLYSMPLSEVSEVGNGAVYRAPTSGGPVINLTTENGDFIASGSTPPIQLKTAARVDQPNVLQMQCLSRTSNYNPSVVSRPDQGSIAIYGVRKADPIQNYAVQDTDIAAQLLGIAVRNLQYGGDKYTFTLPAKWCLLAPLGAGSGGNFTPAPAGPFPPAPNPIPPGHGAAWATATIAGDTSQTGMPVIGEAVGGLTSAYVTMTAGSPLSANSYSWTVGGFEIPGDLPPGATITAIYPVAVISEVVPAQDTYVTPISGINVAGTYVGADLGTSLTGLSIIVGLQNSLPGAFYSVINASFVGMLVYYTAPNPPVGYPLAAYSTSGSAVIDAVLTITDPLADINQIPVRITSMTESPNGTLACEAVPFIYGMNDPSPIVTDTPAPFTPATGGSPGSVNTPIIFEAVPRLAGLSTQPELWCVLSSNNANYGGCQPYISTDGGSSYTPVGDPLVGSAVTGVSTADWPAGTDPDTTHNLALNLSESNGTLASYSTTARDKFQYPCYIAGGGSYAIPYELLSYNAATLTSANHYTIDATGAGNEIRRGVYAAPSPGIGVDHPITSRFAVLNPNMQGILTIPIDPAWIGTTLYFKFCAFNTFGSAAQALSAATPYSYTITGVPGSIGPSTGILVGGV